MPYIRNRTTGQTIWVDDARATPPQKPSFPYEAPQAAATLGKTGADTVNTQAQTRRTAVQTAGDALDNQGKQRALVQNPISKEDAAAVQRMREATGDLPAVIRDIGAAAKAIDAFQPSPMRGNLYAAGIPEQDDWLPTAAIKNYTVGSFLPQAQKENFQTLSGLQNAAVLNAQLAQKGPQTDSDAIRMKLTAISPMKDVQPNARIIGENMYDAQMKQQKPSFYTYWANRLGSLGALNHEGKSVDQVWNENYQRGLSNYRNRRGGAVTRGQPQADSQVIDFDKWGR